MSMDRPIEKKKWPRRRIIAWSATGVIVVTFAYLLLFQAKGSSLNVEAERLSIFTVKKGPFQEYIPVIGTVMPLNTIYLDAVEGGRVEKIYITAGNTVKKDESILQLSNTSVLLNIMYNEAQLFQQSNSLRSSRLLLEQNRLNLSRDVEQVAFELEKVKRRYERLQKLHEDGIISGQEFEDCQREYEFLKKKQSLTIETRDSNLRFSEQQIQQLEQSLRRMEENLAIAKQKLENLTVRAPEGGLLSSLRAEVGQSKAPGERLGQIDVMDGHRVRAQIDEHYIDRIEIGKEGQFDFSGSSYRLKVTKVFPEVQDNRFEVDLSFLGVQPAGIRRGQSLHTRLELSDVSEAVLLERGGFYQKTGGNWVFVLDEGGKTARKRSIRLGRQNSDYFEVVEGLAPGERVITSSYDNFGDMDILNIK